MVRADIDDVAVCVVPAARCCSPLRNDPLSFCGAIAAWLRPLGGGADPSFICDAHRLEGDLPLPVGRVFRRVRVTAEIFLSGVSQDSAIAQTEAIQVLERAVGELGGYLDLKRVWSSRVRAGLPPGAAPADQVGGDTY